MNHLVIYNFKKTDQGGDPAIAPVLSYNRHCYCRMMPPLNLNTQLSSGTVWRYGRVYISDRYNYYRPVILFDGAHQSITLSIEVKTRGIGDGKYFRVRFLLYHQNK